MSGLLPPTVTTLRYRDKQITGSQCRAARGLLGWTQHQLATEIRLTKQAISFYERGNGLLRIRHQARIWDVLAREGVRLSDQGEPERISALE